MHRLTGLLLPLTVAVSLAGCKGKSEGATPSPQVAPSSAVTASATPPSTPVGPTVAATTPSSAPQPGAEAKMATGDLGAPGPLVVEPPIILKKDQGANMPNPLAGRRIRVSLLLAQKPMARALSTAAFSSPAANPNLPLISTLTLELT